MNFERNQINIEDTVVIWVVGNKKVGGGVNTDRFRLLSRNCIININKINNNKSYLKKLKNKFNKIIKFILFLNYLIFFNIFFYKNNFVFNIIYSLNISNKQKTIYKNKKLK